MKESFLGKYPVEVINNGIDLDVFKPTESDFREKHNLENKFIILGVASVWSERKGLKYFIQLSERLDDKYQIIIVGVSEKQKKNLPKHIIGITKTNDTRELAEIYTSSDIFFNPTLEDNFPTTNLESLACGTPIITFNTGGSVECINSKVGYIIGKGDINNTIRVINNYFDSKECIKKSKEYNKSERYNDYIKLYEFII